MRIPIFDQHSRERTRSGVLIPIGVALLVVVGACDRNALSPLQREATPRPVVDQPVTLGSTFIPSPPTSASGSSADYTVATVPDSTWVLVRADGGIKLTQNPECGAQPPNYPCPGTSPTGAFSTNAPLTWGPVAVWAWTGTSGGWMKMRGSGGDGNNPGSAVGLVYIGQAGGIAARISVPEPIRAWNALTGLGPASWLMAGGYNVSARAVPSPFRVTESAPDSSGTVTYTAETVEGLQFFNPLEFGAYGWPAGAAYWRFFPGDSLPDKPDHSWPGWSIPECEHRLVCRWAPPVPGRMQVGAYVETKLAYARSKPEGSACGTQAVSAVRTTCVPLEPKLSLTCNGRPDSVTVERGGQIDCRAEVSPPGGGPITWAFAADSSAYRNPVGSITPHRGTSWAGKMVLSGTITARATVEARPLEASVHVRVAARSWAGKAFEATAAEDSAPAGEFTARPDTVRQLGHIHNNVRYVVERDYWEPILSGPNGLLGYFVKIPLIYQGQVHVNRLALKVGSDFWSAQLEKKPQLQPGDIVPCTRADVEPSIPIILQHEGVGFDPKSHAYLWVEHGKKEFGPATEPIVGTSAQDLYDQAVAALRPAVARADSATKVADTAGYAPVYCSFNYRYPR